MWGFIDQVSEVVDPLWYFPKEVFDKRQKEDIVTSIDTLTAMDAVSSVLKQLVIRKMTMKSEKSPMKLSSKKDSSESNDSIEKRL